MPLGYADGIPRCATGKPLIFARGRRWPIAGTVCMDQLVIDFGDEPVTEGEEVVLFGPGEDGEATAQEWGEELGTISYEIVTGIGPACQGRTMGEVTLTVATAAQMRDLGRSLASVLRAGDLVILSGGLGAGKTTLTQGIGDGLGVRGPITSPTFVIARVHPSVTADGHRPAGAAAGTRRRVPARQRARARGPRPGTDTAAAVTVVEWGEGLAEGLADDRLEIAITSERRNDR